MGKLDYYPWQIPQQGAAHYKAAKLLVDPYVMGVWLGDGSPGGKITSADLWLVDEICRLGYWSNKPNAKDKSKCPTYNPQGLRVALRKEGVLGKRSWEKSIPRKYMESSVRQRTELLRGLMDADGTICATHAKGCEFSSVSHQLALDVQWLVRSLGGKASIKQKQGKLNGVEHRICYRVRVTMSINPFKLPRKAKLWRKPTQSRYLSRTIKSVEKVRQEESVCITVEHKSHCYLTNDFIVTHNTSFLASIIWHFFITGIDPKIAVLSITKDHLKSNLWAELSRARDRSKLLTISTNGGTEKITMKKKEEYCFIDARSFPKSADENQQASALAGLHSDFVMFAIDEGGMIPDAVFSTADAALSTGDSSHKRARLIVTANAEQPSGIIYRATKGTLEQKWATYRITGDPEDPKRSPLVAKEWAQEQINLYGRDHPWVQVNVLGQYPTTSSQLLLTEEEIDLAMKRDIPEKSVSNAQHRLGVDVARGGTDSTVLSRRRGLLAYPMDLLPSSLNGPEVAGKIQFMAQESRIERTFVDDTGGYGSSVVDSLGMATLMMDTVAVKFNASAQDKLRYFNKRTEMWVRMRDWVRKGGKLPNDPHLKTDLMAPKIYILGSVMRLEEKEQIKARIGRSPDRADALALTFADVETASFFADHASAAHDPNVPPWERHQLTVRPKNNYLSSEEDLDKNSNYAPNYRS